MVLFPTRHLNQGAYPKFQVTKLDIEKKVVENALMPEKYIVKEGLDTQLSLDRY